MNRRLAGCLLAVHAICATPVAGQRGREDIPEQFSLSEILSAPFATALTASPDRRAVAWIGYERGARNVWVAEAPGWRARRLTRWNSDDGQPLSQLTWTADSRALLVVRGGEPGGNWSRDVPVNPTSDPAGTEQAIWLVPRAGAPRRVGEGHTPVPSPAGDRVAFVLRDTIRSAPLRAPGAVQIMFRVRGRSGSPAWDPAGTRLAFVSRRDDHSFIGIYDVRRRRITWVSPGTWRDDFPRWSPDGRSIAFIRRAGLPYATGLPLPPVQGEGPPQFTIMLADTDADSGAAREVWRSPSGPEGALPGLAGQWTLQWAAGGMLLFASEHSGWLGLHSVGTFGVAGSVARLTPDGCEVQDVVLNAAQDTIYYASNCGDVDRRHVQRVSVTGGVPEQLTSGPGIEWAPALTDSGVAVLRSDWQNPAAPALLIDGRPQVFEGWSLPSDFPRDALVQPRQVVVRAADSTPVHLQVFEPPQRDGLLPVVLFLHGGPQRQMLLGWHDRHYYHNAYAFNQYLASRGFLVVSVNFRGGIGYGRAFRDAPRRGRFGLSEYQDVMAAAAWARAQPYVDTARIGLWGGSYGGYLTALGLARNSDVFAAGVDLHGVHDYADEIGATRSWGVSDSAIALFRRNSPVSDITSWRSPVLLIAGDDDRNVEFQQTTDLAVRLRRRGVRVEELVFPDDVHGFLLHRNWLTAYRRAGEFLAAVLRSRPAGAQ